MLERLLLTGGVIAIVGLYQSRTVLDRLVGLAALPVNAGLAASRPSQAMTAPASEPTMELGTIRAVASETLPGSRTRRLLLWRYLLTWTKPSTK